MTSANRFQLFTFVHKGLRAALFECAGLRARTDFEAPEESGAAARSVARLAGLLDEHAEHEDAVILPVVEALSPECFIALRAEHARTDGLQRDLVALAGRLVEAGAAERPAIGRRLHDRTTVLVAEHLLHMQREEQEVQRLLWAHRTDDELRALEGQVLARMTPARRAEWLGLILPALSLPERAAFAGAPVARP